MAILAPMYGACARHHQSDNGRAVLVGIIDIHFALRRSDSHEPAHKASPLV